MGIYLNSMYDLRFNNQGILIGVFGALITSVYQVLVGKKQKDLELNALQLLFYQAPLSALLLLFVIPFFEPLFETNGAFCNSRTINEIYFKFILIIGFGIFMYRDPLEIEQFLSFVIIMIGKFILENDGI